MSILDITYLNAPASAKAGDTINLSYRVKYVMYDEEQSWQTTGTWVWVNGTMYSSVPGEQDINLGEEGQFTASFTMPNSAADVRIDVSYRTEPTWEFAPTDVSRSVTIALIEEPEPEPEPDPGTTKTPLALYIALGAIALTGIVATILIVGKQD